MGADKDRGSDPLPDPSASLDIDRSMAAQQVLDLLKSGHRHVHVQGPPGFGKKSLVHALAQTLQDRAIVVDLADSERSGTEPLEHVWSQVKGAADDPADWPHGDWVAGWERILAHLPAADEQRLVLIVSTAEHLFFEQEASAWSAELLARADLVTVSLAPLHLILPSVSRNAAEQMTVHLRAFPAPATGSGYDEAVADARANAQDEAGYLAEGRAWFERYIASRTGAAPKRDTLQRVFQLKYEQRRDELWEGHPLINIRALEHMLDSVLAGCKASEALDEFRADLTNLRFGPLAGRLLPFRTGDEGAVSPAVAEEVADALSLAAEGGTLDERRREWLIASGWFQPGVGDERSPWSRLATLFDPDPDSPSGRSALRDWAHETILVARNVRRALVDLRHDNDSTFRTTLDLVGKKYRESEMGARRDMRIEHSECRTIVPGQMYSFRLSFLPDAQPEPDQGNKPVAAKRASLDILVFTTQGEGPRFWRHHIRILSMLGRMRHPALIPFGRGGDLVSDEGVQEPAPLAYIEIGQTFERVASQRVPELVASLRKSPDDHDENVSGHPVFTQIVHLAEALDLIHAQGILHRAIDFSALALDRSGDEAQLVLTGFEFSANLRSELMARQWSSLAAYRQAVWNLACRAPEWCPGRADDIEPSIDVYAFGALATMLATGLPDRQVMWKVDALLPVGQQQADPGDPETLMHAASPAHELLREDLLRRTRWEGLGDNLQTLQNLLGQCLSVDPAMRPTMEDLSLQLREWHEEYLASFVRPGNELHVSYAHDQMGEMLKRLELVDEDQNLEGPEGRAWLQTKVQEWVNAAKWMHYRENGFPKQGNAEAVRTRKEAKFVLAGPGVVFFASLYRRSVDAPPDHRVLWLAFALHRHEILLPDPDDLALNSPRTTKEDTTWIPKPMTVEVIAGNEIQSLENPGSWEPTTSALIRRGQLASRERRLGREAAAVWRLHRDIQLALEALRSFPVTIHRDKGSEHGSFLLELNEDAFRRSNEYGPFNFLRQVILERQKARAFFVDTVQGLAEAAGASQLNFLIYPRTKGRRGGSKRLVGSIILPVMDNKVRMRLEQGSEDLVPSEARIVWFDSFGTEAATDRQSMAIDRLERRSWLMDLIVTPRDCGLLERPVSRSCGRMLDARDEYLRELTDRVRMMLSSDPLHAVQGPPGTGKTTLIAALVGEVLRAEDGSRLLVTSQSHAATDNVLVSVMNSLDKLARREGDDQSPPTTAVRLFSETTRDSVAQGVRRRFSINSQVREAQARMKASAASFEAKNSIFLQKARHHLLRAATKGYLETRFRIEQSSPLIFSTTGAAMTSADYLRRGAIGFDYVLIDEAAKAWAVDLVQPLALADRAILVGDQEQLPPFGEQEMGRILENARLRRGRADVPPDLDYLLDESESDDGGEAPFERMQGWLKIFHRLFEKRSADSSTPSSQKRIPLTQSLDRQFRSVPAIGSLVSDTFYRKISIRNSGPDPDTALRLPIPLVSGDPEFAPAIAWIDTSRIKKGSFYSRSGARGMMRNDGEAKLVAQLLKNLRLTHDASDPDSKPPWERLRILSPYKAQVMNLRAQFRDASSHLGIARDDLPRLLQTVDASQGSEADIVIISLCRRFDGIEQVERTSEETAAARQQRLKREINTVLGFLQESERINVLISRARHQLILVGDFSYFARGAQLLDERKRITTEPSESSFWTNLQSAFSNFDSQLHASPSGLERPVVLPVDMIAGASE